MLGNESLEGSGAGNIGRCSVDVNGTGTSVYYGIGAAFKQVESLMIRTRVHSHDSGERIGFTVGFWRMYLDWRVRLQQWLGRHNSEI